jgi:uncharacterized protein YhdP
MQNTAGKVTSAPGWRAALGVLAAAVALFATAALTYQLALASIPAHRATLENLVRARTGLDVRFDELGLRWGWYGPEAVFSRVELREPGEPDVLVRAAELTVGVDAWRTMQSGQLEAGRITLVAPDIDIARLELRPRATLTAGTRVVRWSARPLLARWPNGRMDIEGGTLRFPDPSGSGGSLSLAIRRATLRRADELWSAEAHTLLPERFGRELKLSLQLRADARNPSSIGGVVHIEGERLVLASWRELLARTWGGSHDLPSAGEGRIVADLQLRGGRLEGGHGSVRAQDLILRSAAGFAPREVHLASVRGAWHLTRSAGIWHVTADDVALGSRVPGRSPGDLALEVAENGQWIRGTLRNTPIEARLEEGWPGVSSQLEELRGSLHEFKLDWASGRAPGERLRVAASIGALAVAARGAGVALEGVTAHLSGTDTRLLVDIESPRGKLTVTGALHAGAGAEPPTLTMHATLTDADVATLQALVGNEARQVLGPRAARLNSGTITHADFAWAGMAGAPPLVRASSGSATLRGALLEGGDSWPAISGLDAHLEWRGIEWRASVARASAGPFQLLGLNAAWRSDAAGGMRCSGQAEGRIEDVLEWLRGQPQLDGYQLAKGDFAAQGDAIFALDAFVPRGAKSGNDNPRVHITAQLDGAAITLASQIPPLEAVRGTLTFDGGRLQRSMLTAAWLGGPVALRVAERRAGDAWGLTVQAQGTLEARQLATVAATDLGTLDVAGRTSWRGDLAFTPATGTRPVSWHAQADTALIGITSRLPAPLAKQGPAPAPVHIEIDGAADSALVHLSLADTLRGVLALREDPRGWRPAGGDLRFGGAPAQDAPSGRIEVLGRLPRVDLAPWIIAWRGFAASAMALPLRTHLTIDELLLAGHSYRGVAVAGKQDDDGLELTLDGASLQGSLTWPAHPQPGSLVEARFDSLQMPPFGAAVDFAPLLAALGPVAQLEIQKIMQQDHVLGRLSTRLELKDHDLTIDPLTLEGARDELWAALHCSFAGPCRLRFALDTRDAATTLRDFGLRADLQAERGSLTGELEWPLSAAQSSPRQWLTSVRGRVRLALADGAAQAAGSRPGSPFAIVAVPELLRDPPASLRIGESDAEGRELKFARVGGEFDIRDGSAYTSDLHFDGDAEILMSGRTGLVDQDYDYQALILRGEDRLPAAVRRFAAVPKVAAAWMALRELVAGSEPDPSRLQLRLQGSWQAPTITAAR